MISAEWCWYLKMFYKILGQVSSCEGWQSWEKTLWIRPIVLFGTVWPGLLIVSLHSRHSKRRRQDWEVRGVGGGGFSSSGKTRTIKMSRSYSRFLSVCHCVFYRKREMVETSLFFVSGFQVQTKGGDWQGQGSTVAWLVHSSPLHPTRCNSTYTVSGRAQSNNKMSILHSLPALSKGLIQRIAASLYLHTNKKEDVDSYRCLPLSACQQVSGYLPFFPPFSLPRAIRALEPPLSLIRQRREDMTDKYDWGHQISASITALEHIGVWWQQQGNDGLLNRFVHATSACQLPPGRSINQGSSTKPSSLLCLLLFCSR